MSKYSIPLSLLLLVSLTISCQRNFVEQSGDFNPDLNRPIKLLEGKFSVLDLFYMDSVPSANSQVVTVTNELYQDELDLTAAIPVDSMYSVTEYLLPTDQSYRIDDHGELVQSVNQLNFIQAFAPSDFGLFNSNNGASITWAGCNSYSNYYFGAVSVPEVFDDIHIDSGEYDITLVNNLDFEVTIGVSLKSNPSVLWSQLVTIASGGSSTFTVNIKDADANASYNWTIYQVSTPGLSAGSAPIDNANTFDVKVSRSNAYLSSGKFRPSSHILSQKEFDVSIPVAQPKKYNYIDGDQLEFDNYITASGLAGTSLELHREFSDQNGVLHTDVISIVSSPATINWIVSLSNMPISPIQGNIHLSYTLQSAPNDIVEIEPTKAIVVRHGFQMAPKLNAVGFNESLMLSHSSTTTPYDHWPEELTLSFLPIESSIDREFQFTGWGKVHVNSQLQNHIATVLNDDTVVNCGSSFIDTNINSQLSWSLGAFNTNAFNTLTPDSLTASTIYLFEAPWGMRINRPVSNLGISHTKLEAISGTARLHSEKLFDLSDNYKLDSLIGSCDSISAFATISSNTQLPVTNSFSLTRSADTIIAFNNVLLPGNTEITTDERMVEDPLSLNALMTFTYDVDFTSPNIALQTRDSLFLDLYFKFFGLP